MSRERQQSPSLAMQDRVPRFQPVLIMYHPSMQALAENLVRRVQEEQSKYSAHKVTRSIMTVCVSVCRVQGEREGAVGRYRSVELWTKISWSKFRDGWPNIFIDKVEDIAGRDGG